jgi:hypothetical protein
VTDESAQVTATSGPDTWAAGHNPLATDSNGNWDGDPSTSYSAPVTDAYGYQEVGGDGTYNPNVTSDGTDLSQVTVVPDGGVGGPGCETSVGWHTKLDKNGNPIEGWAWLTVGEQHAYWNSQGWYTYTQGAQTTYSVLESVNGGDFTFGYNASYTSGASWSTGIYEGGVASYLNVLATNWAEKEETLTCPHGAGKQIVDKVVRTGIHEEPNNPNWDPYNLGPNITYEDGPVPYASAQYISGLRPGQSWCLNQNKGVDYKFAATFGFVTVSDETAHTQSSQQCIKEGKSRQRTHHV